MTLLRIALALVGLLVLPGLAAAALSCRRHDTTSTPERFVGVALAAGLSTWLVTSEILTKVGALTAGPVVLATVAIAVASVVVIAGPGRPGFAILRSSAGLIALVVPPVVTAVAGAPLLRGVADRPQSLRQPTPWYYWRLVQETVAAHGVPASSAEWGTRVAFLDDYGAFTAGTGVLSVAGGSRTSLVAADVVQCLALLAAGVAVYVLTRAWGASRPASAVAIGGFLALDFYVSKLSSFRPEASSYALALLAAVFARWWMLRRRRSDLVMLGVLLFTLGQSHAIVWTLALAMVGATCVAGLDLGERGSRVATAARTVVPVVAIALVMWLAGGLLFGGELGGAGKLGDVPTGAADPTWRFQALTTAGVLTGAPPASATLAKYSLQRGFSGMGWPWHAVLALVTVLGLGAVALVARGRSRRMARRFLLFTIVTIALVVVVALGFALGWSTYVPRRTGWGRLLPLVAVLLPVGVGVAVSLSERRQVRIAICGIAAAAAAALLVHGLDSVDRYEAQQPSDATLTSLRGLHLRPGEIVLSNSYTEGFLRVVLGEPGLLEGRAPYTERGLLFRSNRLLRESQAFFRDPGDRRIPGRHVRHVLVAVDKGWTTSTPYVFPTDVNALERRPDLRLEAVGPGYRLYAVR